MTIDEAIEHEIKIAEMHESDVKYAKLAKSPTSVIDLHKKCAAEHRQLAEWLKDYKKLLGAIEDINADIYKTSCFYYGSQIGEGLEMALHTIDRHLRRKEEE